MTDARSSVDRCSRRGFLAGAGTGLVLATGTASSRPVRGGGSTIVVEADDDATGLARAMVGDLESKRPDVEARLGRSGRSRQLDEGRDDGLAVLLSVEQAEAGEHSSPTDGEIFEPVVDLARFVPSKRTWYRGRDRRIPQGTERRTGERETWIEIDGRVEDTEQVVRDLSAQVDRVRPRRPPGSAPNVFLYGTRAFQYASGFGGEKHYEVDGDRLQSLDPDAAYVSDGSVVIRTARVAVDEPAKRVLGAGTISDVLAEVGTGSSAVS